ncbi:MAG: TatD family hydrolase [Bacilli bacterium]|nr:TatD family hydrolase [Bacilli bacterium]
MIDTHCHILKEDYDNQEEVIKRMKDNIIIVSSASPKDIDEIIELIEKYDNVYGTIGIHPEFAKTYKEEDLKKIEKYLIHPKIVGIGEIGLDYHYTSEEKAEQKNLFKKQILLANKYNKTIVIHSRDAKEDTYNMIEKYKDANTKYNMHCYSYDLEMAQTLTKQNITLGIGGILTFKNEKKLKEIVKEIELEYLLLETDSPYLTPEPHRGKKNEPINIKYVAQKIAEIKNIDYNTVIEKTTQNALRQFNINEKNRH